VRAGAGTGIVAIQIRATTAGSDRRERRAQRATDRADPAVIDGLWRGRTAGSGPSESRRRWL